MRICLYCPTVESAPHAVPSTIDAIARQLTQRGHLISVLAIGHAAARRDDDDAQTNPPYALHRIAPMFRPDWFPERGAATLRSFQRANDFELMLALGGHPAGYAAVRAAHEAEIPCVLIAEGNDVRPNSPLRRRGHVWKRVEGAYRNADAVAAVSGYVRTMLEQIDDGEAMNLVSITNGVDTEAMSKPARRPEDFDDPRPFMLVMPNLDGGDSEAIESEIDTAMIAFNKGRGRLGETLLLVMADDPRGQRRRRASRLEASDRIEFIGRRRGEARRWFVQRARYALLPGREQGDPTPALEVMAAGRPVITASPSGFDEVCQPGVNGLRVPPDSPNELTDAIARMQRFDIETMGLCAMQAAQDYDWSTVAGRYLELFELLLAESATPARRIVHAATG